jgi:hypothetical protein
MLLLIVEQALYELIFPSISSFFPNIPMLKNKAKNILNKTFFFIYPPINKKTLS